MEIFHRPPTAKGLAATFTGDVWVDGVYAGPSQEQARLAVVRFAPCARSHWHSHRVGQVLHVRDGSDEPQTVWGEAVTDSDYQAPRTPTR